MKWISPYYYSSSLFISIVIYINWLHGDGWRSICVCVWNANYNQFGLSLWKWMKWVCAYYHSSSLFICIALDSIFLTEKHVNPDGAFVYVWICVSFGNVDCPCRDGWSECFILPYPKFACSHWFVIHISNRKMCKSWRRVCNVLLLEMWITNQYVLYLWRWMKCVCVFVCPYYRSSSFLLMLTFLTEKHAVLDGASLSLSLCVNVFCKQHIIDDT